MSEFDEIDAMKFGNEKNEKFIEYYREKVNVESWLNNPFKNSIITFKDRTEYKKNNQYHRINGPAIEYEVNSKESEYYYKGIKYEFIDWEKITIKVVRKIKIKKLNKNEKSSDF